MEFYSAKGFSANEGQDDAAISSFHSATLRTSSHQGFAVWRQTIEVLFDATAVDRNDFSASLAVYHFNRFLFCKGDVGGARYCRDGVRLKWCDLDHYLLHLPLHKGLVCGNGLRVRPRDVVVLDLSQPAGFSMAAGEGISLLIPRTALPPLLYDMGQLHGLVLRRESASGVLLAQLFSSLELAVPRLSRGEAFRLTLPILGMVAACLGQVAAHAAAAPRTGPVDLGRRVRLYIEQNLQREDLSPGVLAKELGVSRSQLYRAFEKFGGVRQYLLRRRLRRCLFALCDPANAVRRIADLAYDHGFADEAHFSRLFRQAFGLSPRATKAALQRGELSGFSHVTSKAGGAPALADWVRELTSS